MENIRKTLLFIGVLFASFFSVQAQDIDFTRSKEWSTLNQLNPAFTGVYNQLRILSHKGNDWNLGFESRLLASKNYVGFVVHQQHIDDFDRKSFQLSYARNLIDKTGILLKVAGDVQFESKVLGEALAAGKRFTDYDGYEYLTDSSNLAGFVEDVRYARVNIGGALLLKNIVVGFTARNLNQPNISIRSDQDRTSPLDATFMAAGFLPVLPKLTIAPSVLGSVQGGSTFVSAGVTFRSEKIGLVSQYELLDGNSQLELGILVRYKRYFIQGSYIQDLAVSGFQPDNIRLTINASLLKLFETKRNILTQLKTLY
ncbi:MAG: type IX secretion system membrane protein PorP/SprF [Flavobacteriales bacterium]|nr:type IX secretion system membrane protein PorP/SprF [Bacteroidota bacterium]MCB9239597.1 type IX secretion system membrane protein PorP/SprF [Flavobacteriales bacterium]